MRAVYRRPRPSDGTGLLEFLQKSVVEGFPDTSLLPSPKIIPTSHAAAAAHLDRQILPWNSGLEYEDYSGQYPTRIQRLAARKTPTPTLGRRQQRFNPCPQGV